MKTGKRILATFLVVLMLLTSAPLSGFADTDWSDFKFSLSKVEFSKALKSVGEAFGGEAEAVSVSDSMAWCESLLGQKVGSGQCVAFIQAYYSYLGVSPVAGHAYQYSTNALPSGWSRVQGGIPQAGDILVYTGAKYGHVAIYAGGSVSYHQNIDGEKVSKRADWNYNRSWFSSTENGTKSYWGYIRPNFSSKNPEVNNPQGCIDSVSGGAGKIDIGGWAFDSDDLNAQLNIHVYIGDEGHSDIYANKERTDVNNVFGCGNYHGFMNEVYTGKTGRQTVSVYVINVGGGGNILLWQGEVDITPPMTFSSITSAHDDSIQFGDYDTTTLCGQYKYWFKKHNNETNYYVNMYLDGNQVAYNTRTDGAGWYSWTIDTTKMSNGRHELKMLYAHTYGSWTVTKYFYVSNDIVFSGITEKGNDSKKVFEGVEIPTLTGQYKYWYKKNTNETNYYINVTIDGNQVAYNTRTDGAGWYSWDIDTTTMSDGQHEIRITYACTTFGCYIFKKFNVSNKTVTVTFNGNGGNVSTGPKNVLYTSTYGTLPTPNRSNWNFDGWYTAVSGGTKITADTKVTNTSNHTLYAHWSHNHSYASSITTQATCNIAGVKTYRCSICGNTYTESISAKGHTTDSGTVTTQPTCTKEGVKTFKCIVCGETLKTEPVEKIAHTYKSVVTVPTCEEKGYTTYTCSACGDKQTKVIPATGHKKTVTIPAQKATCTTPGNTAEEVCSVCGTVLSELKIVPATGHTDKNGDNKCDTCGASLGEQNPSENCSCNCHKSGFMGFIWKIINFFNKIFKSNPVCACGVKHY